MHLYVDEAGTSDIEPTAIVAGVLINPYQQVRFAERQIATAVDEIIPENLRPDFVFHAKEIANNRSINPDDGAKIIARWLDILFLVGLPISIAWFPKEESGKMDRQGRPIYTKQSGEIAHMISFARCINQADRLVREFHPGVVATVFAEDIDGNKRAKMRGMIKKIQSNPGIFGDFTSEPIEHIRNGISWVAKEDCEVLQLADAVAYSFRRYHQKIRFGDYLKWAMVGRPLFKIDWDRTAAGAGSFVQIPVNVSRSITSS